MMKVIFECPRSTFVARYVLLGLMAGIAIALLLAPKPWEHPHLGKLEDYVRVYSWWAGLINLVPLACLALTTGWWARPMPAHALEKSLPKLPKGFFLCVGGAMAACAILGFPRLGQSLWDDEEYCVRRCTVGGYRVQEDGNVVVKKLPWKVTLWNRSDDQSHISKHPFAIDPLRLADHRTAHRAATQRGRRSVAQLRFGHPPRGRRRFTGGALRPCVGGRACGLAYCHSPVAPAIHNRSARLRVSCTLNPGQLPSGRQCVG